MTLPLPTRRSHSILLTSLVDVMFVLFFFFMLTAASVDRRALRLDSGPAARETGGLVMEARLDLLGPASWQLGDRVIEPAALESRLREQRATRVLVIASPGVSLQILTDVIGRLRDAGIELRLGRLDAG
ncbi:MAG: biopolymer transporter ExbD [Panacagrimonas sp.]